MTDCTTIWVVGCAMAGTWIFEVTLSLASVTTTVEAGTTSIETVATWVTLAP